MSTLETSKYFLNSLATLTDQTSRQKVFLGLFSPKVDFTKRALEVLSHPNTVEKIKIDNWEYSFFYEYYDKVSVNSEGIFFKWEHGTKQLILDFEHRITLICLSNLYVEHFSNMK